MATPPPYIPSEVSIVRYVSACVAMVPFETHAAFWPLTIHSSPSSLAVVCPLILGSLNSFVPTISVSEPCSGSVIAQQPTYFASLSSTKGFTSASMISSSMLLAAVEKGNEVTPMAMAKSALAQPISSRRMCVSNGPNPSPPYSSAMLAEWYPSS